ncbi:MAG: hypothetical protein IKV47_04945, partial [Oscillospiraceae bacterium]|nr:hypothetical protein [Oscillospiraceae bacterium]
VFIIAASLLCSTIFATSGEAPEKVTARRTDIRFQVNGEDVSVDLYNIKGNNYIKLRDFAALMTDTVKRFSAEWDSVSNTIFLQTGVKYEPIADDLQPGDGSDRNGIRSRASMLLDGQPVEVEVYNIGGYNYFKIQDLCTLFDIYALWNGDARIAGIYTMKNSAGEDLKAEDEEFSAEDFANAMPRTNEEFYELICYMKENNITSFSETVENVYLSRDEFDELFAGLVEGFHYGYAESAEDYVHHMTFFEGISWQYSWWYDGDGTIHKFAYTLNFTLRDGMSLEDTLAELDAFEAECEAIVSELHTEGILTDAMTTYEKAKVLYEYVDHHLQYDDNYFDVPAYDAIMNDRAVCEGYTAIYNYLCNLVGIPAKGTFGASGSEPHIWTEIEIDGEKYYIDVTWGDPTPDRGENFSDLRYFWISYDELMRLDPKRVFYNSMPWE